MQFVVLSSSRGSTFQAVIDAMQAGELEATCLGLVTDKADRLCVHKAQVASLPVAIVDAKPKPDREAFDRAVHDAILSLTNDDADVVLAEMGWMWIHTPWFIAKWPNRILNVHPALLPKHGGKGMYGDYVHQAVLDAGDSETGITIHIMDDGVDTGPILLQQSCPVAANDTVDTIRTKVQTLEKAWYPQVLQQLHNDHLALP